MRREKEVSSDPHWEAAKAARRSRKWVLVAALGIGLGIYLLLTLPDGLEALLAAGGVGRKAPTEAAA